MNRSDDLEQRRILVVEDDDSIALLVDRVIERSGGSARAVATAGEAMVALDEETWSALVTDIWLPDANGLDLITQIKEQQPHVPILAMSASNIGTQARQRGADDFIAKPFTPSTLLARLKGLLGRESGAD